MKIVTEILKYVIPAAILVIVYFTIRIKSIGKVNYSGAKISDERANIIVTQLVQAMEDFGTDEKMIYALIKPLTPEDFKKVYSFFGLRPYLWFGNAPSWLVVPSDLVQWLKKELGTSNVPLKEKIEKAGFTFS